MTVIDQPRKHGVSDTYEFELSGDAKRLSRNSSRLAARDNLSVNISRQVVEDCNAFVEPPERKIEVRHVQAGEYLASKLISTFQVLAEAEASVVQEVANRLRKLTPPENFHLLINSLTPIAAEANEPESFVAHAQRLAERGRIDAALDLIYDRADEMMLAGEFEPLNELIATLNPSSLSLDILLGILTVTSPAKSKLPARAEFFCDVETILRDRGELVDGLLTGLE